MMWEDIIAKAETFNLMVSDFPRTGEFAGSVYLQFASSCLADQFVGWAIYEGLTVRNEPGSNEVYVW